MERILKFLEHEAQFLMLENVQMAKQLLLKHYAETKKIDPKEITPEEKAEIEKNPKYLKIRDEFAGSNPGWVYPFTKFYIVEGAPWEKILEIVDALQKYRPAPEELKLGNLNNYAEVDIKKTRVPGYEMLLDDIESLVMARKAKKMVDLMPKRIRQKFKDVAKSSKPADIERIKKLVFIANRLESLDPKEMIDKNTGEKVMRTALQSFVKKSRKYDDYQDRPGRPATYPEFADLDVTFDQMIKDGNGEIEGWTSGVDDLRQRLIDLEPASAILYDEDGFIVSSARTSAAMVEVCKIVSGGHCIRNESNFWSYTGGGLVQLNISDFNRSSSDNLALYTMTIKPDGILKESAGSDNNMSTYSRFAGKPYVAVLEYIGYPQALIAAVNRYFPQEQKIKAALERFYKLGNKPATHQILTSLSRVHEGALSGSITQENWLKICGLVAEILQKQLNIKDKEFTQYFKENGIVTESDLKIFQHVVGKNYTPEDAAAIKAATEENMDIADFILTDASTMKELKKDDIAYFKEMLSNKDLILGQVAEL